MNQIDKLRFELISICERTRFDLSQHQNLIVATPYIPFVPERWNGCLVLATAQNLARKSDRDFEYVEKLKRSEKGGLLRLYCEGTDRQVAPWDNAYLKIAVEAAFPDYSADDTAVSNAVLWSEVTKKNGKEKDKNPAWNSPQTEYSIVLWTQMLRLLSPQIEILITAGNTSHYVAEKVLGALSSELPINTKHLRLWDPSGANAHLNRVNHLQAEYELEFKRLDKFWQGMMDERKISRYKKYIVHTLTRAKELTHGEKRVVF